MRRNQVIAALAAALLCTTALAACGSDDDAKTASTAGGGASTSASGGGGAVDSSKPPVVLSVNALKIQAVDLLTPYVAGAQAAADALNAKGGIGGRKVEIDSCNTMYQPATGAKCARETASKKATAMIGCEPTWANSGLPILGKAKIPSFNCPNVEADWKDPWSFGLTLGTNGDNRAFASYLCTRDDVKKVVAFVQDIPISHSATPAAMDPVLKGCGKTAEYVYYPITGADLTPDVAKAAALKPDFVLTQAGGALALQVFKLFSQAGISADKMGASGNAFAKKDVLTPAGATMDGVYGSINVRSWSDTSDPGVAEYQKAMASAGVDADDVNPETAYMTVMAIATAGEEIGADAFDSQSLADWMNKANNVAIPTSREILNPGPTGYPQIKQPYNQIVQWKDGKLNVVTDGTDDGWIKGF
jgi:ABC-type branched-subunit amino acid transport system substrate-binding protein